MSAIDSSNQYTFTYDDNSDSLLNLSTYSSSPGQLFQTQSHILFEEPGNQLVQQQMQQQMQSQTSQDRLLLQPQMQQQTSPILLQQPNESRSNVDDQFRMSDLANPNPLYNVTLTDSGADTELFEPNEGASTDGTVQTVQTVQTLSLSANESFLYMTMMEQHKSVLSLLYDIKQDLQKVLSGSVVQRATPTAATPTPSTPVDIDEGNGIDDDEINVEHFFDMKTKNDLKALENVFIENDQLYRDAFLKKCVDILGPRKATEHDGRSSALELASLLFHNDFWWSFSWKGGSKNKSEPRESFSKHVTFLDFFKRLIRKISYRNLSDDVFATVFKNEMKNRVEPGTMNTKENEDQQLNLKI